MRFLDPRNDARQIVFKPWPKNQIFRCYTFRILRLEEPKIAS